MSRPTRHELREAQMRSRHAGPEDAFMRERERFDALMEMGLDVVAILDGDGTARYISPSARTVLGYDPAEIVGTNALYLVHPDDRPHAEAALARVAASPGAISRSEFRARHRDGSLRFLEIVGANLVEKPAIGGILVNLRDVTERKQVEQLKSDFLSSVSHELRTPLTVIIGYAALLEKRSDALEPQLCLDAAHSIRDRAEQMRWLIEDILELTRAHADSLRRAPETVDVVALVRKCIDETIQADGHQTSVETTGDVVPVGCDPDRFARAMMHLLSNAVKFSPEGGQIRVLIRKDPDRVRIAVSDEGVGIAPADLPHVFNRFTQVDMTSTRKFGGLGVGLFIARQIVEAHGGHIEVESKVGKGSTFTIEMPTVETHEAGAAPDAAEPAA